MWLMHYKKSIYKKPIITYILKSLARHYTNSRIVGRSFLRPVHGHVKHGTPLPAFAFLHSAYLAPALGFCLCAFSVHNIPAPFRCCTCS